MAGLKAPFRAGRTAAASKAAWINDGASALILASASAERADGLALVAPIGQSASAEIAPRWSRYAWSVVKVSRWACLPLNAQAP